MSRLSTGYCRAAMSAVIKKLRGSEALRAVGVPAYRVAARAIFFYPAPRVLANSMPKAGTHLLTALLGSLPKMMFSGIHRALNDFSISPGISPDEIPDIDVERLERVMASVNRGQFMTAHFPAHPSLAPVLEKLGYRSVLILRDPRDIAVSHAFYVTGLERHPLHRRYNERYSSASERIMASITGFPADEDGPGQESIGQRVLKYAPWLHQTGVHVCRFEELVGPRGGGHPEKQRSALSAVTAHVGRPLDEGRLAEVADRVWSPDSATFRSGIVGDWRNHFSEDHVRRFKEVAGDQLIALGYENDHDWR